MLECSSLVFLWVMLFPQTKKKKRITGSFYLPPRGPFLESGSVKSDTLSWVHISLSHDGCEAVTLWWVHSVSLLIPSIWHHPVPVCYSLAHSPKLSKHFWGCANLSASSNVWQEDTEARNGVAHLFDICWHHSIRMVICCYSLQKLLNLDVRRNTWERPGFVYLLGDQTSLYNHLLRELVKSKSCLFKTHTAYALFWKCSMLNTPTEQCTCKTKHFLPHINYSSPTQA